MFKSVLSASIMLWLTSVNSYAVSDSMSNVTTIKNELKLVGKAKFSFMFWDIYNSAYYTETGQYLPENKQRRLLEIKYLRDIKQKDLINTTIEQWQNLGISRKKYHAYVSQLYGLWPDITKGDSLTFYTSSNANYFYHNGSLLGRIRDKEFGALFLAIWLSKQTDHKKLRSQLIGEIHES